jgi:cytochrome P450 family 135
VTLPPGPRVLGSIQAISMLRDPLGFFQRCQDRYGDVFTLPFGTALHPTVWVCDPALVEQVIAAPADQLEAGSANAILRPLVGEGSTLLLTGEEHAARRALLSPQFDHTQLGRDRAEIAESTADELRSWRSGEVISLWSWVRRLTMEIMLRVVFGISGGPQRERLALALADIVERNGSIAMLMPRLRVDLGRLSPWGQFLRHKAALDALLHAEIAARRADPMLELRGDVLSMALRARYPDGRTLTDAEVRDEMMTLIIAGNQTTAGGLAWTLEMLLRHPVEMARVREDLAGGGEAYLGAAIEEALRLRTPLFGLGRSPVVDYRLGRFTIPRGTGIAVPLLLVYRSPAVYRDPTLYRPQRHLDPGAPHPSWVPFGGGIRSCIGAGFARLQIGLILREILTCAELELVDPGPERLRLRAGALVVPSREVSVRVTAQHAPAASALSPAIPGRR